MKRRRVTAVLLWMIVASMWSRQAYAQASQPLQMGAGYQFVHQSVDRGGETFPVGGYVDVEQAFTADQTKSIGWMGQFEANFRSDSGFSEQLYTVLGGVRIASTKSLRWSPSGFGLLGVATLNASCDIFCAGSDTGLALQGGFAMTTRLNRSTLLDIAFKATKLKNSDTGVFDVALAAGIRFNLTR